MFTFTRAFIHAILSVTQTPLLLITCSSFHALTFLNFMCYGFCPHTSPENALHCFYLFLKLTCFHSHSMKLTFLPYWLFLSLLLISQQAIDIHKSSSDCNLFCFTNLTALTNLFTPKSLITILTFYVRPSLISLFFRTSVPDCSISNLNSKYLKVNFSFFLPKAAVVPLCPISLVRNHINLFSLCITSSKTKPVTRTCCLLHRERSHESFSPHEQPAPPFWYRCEWPCIWVTAKMYSLCLHTPATQDSALPTTLRLVLFSSLLFQHSRTNNTSLHLQYPTKTLLLLLSMALSLNFAGSNSYLLPKTFPTDNL